MIVHVYLFIEAVLHRWLSMLNDPIQIEVSTISLKVVWEITLIDN